MIDETRVLDVIEDLECELSFCRAVEVNNATLFVSDLESYLDVINGQKAEIEALIAGQETLQKYITEKDKEIERLQKYNTDVAFKHYNDGVKEFAESIINNVLPEYMKGHEEMALRISFAISQKAEEMVVKIDE